MDDKERYDEICSKAFQSLGDKIDDLGIAIRGNGVPGLLNRMTALETRLNVSNGIWSFISKNWLMLIVALMMLLSLAQNKGKIDRGDIKEIVTQVEKLQP